MTFPFTWSQICWTASYKSVHLTERTLHILVYPWEDKDTEWPSAFFSINNSSPYTSEDIQRALTPGRKGSRWTCVHELAALQKCQCVKSIFNAVVPAVCSPAKRSLSAVLQTCCHRGQAMMSKQRHWNYKKKTKHHTPPSFNGNHSWKRDGKSCSVSQAPPFDYASPRAERTLASRAKYAERNTLVYTGS